MTDYGKAALGGGLLVVLAAGMMALATGRADWFGYASVGAGLIVVSGIDYLWHRRR